jgi:hypothetical protein
VEEPGKLRALLYLSGRKPVPQRYRAWLDAELKAPSPTRFALKSTLLNVIVVLVMALLVLGRGHAEFAVAFVLLAAAMLAFVALVPDVGRRRMAHLAERNGLASGTQAQRPADVPFEARLEARREIRRRQGQYPSDGRSGQ